ncbi:hypothetical protein INQ23_25170, partial [Escherichia coli]|nr:hypothetical protein [Escherichia coli]
MSLADPSPAPGGTWLTERELDPPLLTLTDTMWRAAELFGDDDDAASEPAPANDIIDFDCAHFNQGLDAVEAIKDS